MKSAGKWLVGALALVIAIVVAWKVLLPARVGGARLAPAETMAFLHLPDLGRSGERWKQLSVAKIAADPGVKKFLEKPLAYLQSERGGDVAGELMQNLQPREIFLALTAQDATRYEGLVGVRYSGSPENFAAAITRLRQELGEALESGASEYHGIPIQFTRHADTVLYTTTQKGWGFLANDLAVLEGTLDRLQGRAPQSLATDSLFQQIGKRLPAEAEFQAFLRTSGLLAILLQAGEQMGAQPDERQVAEARKVEAAGYALKFQGADMRDTIFILRADPPDVGSLTHRAIQFTTEHTLVYFDFVMNLGQLQGGAHNLTALVGGLLGGAGVDAGPLPEIFGPECSLTISWPPETFRPEGLLAIQVQDAEAAEEWLRATSAAMLPQTQASEQEGVRVYSFPTLAGGLANPSVAITPEFLLLGLNEPEVVRAAVPPADAKSLENLPAFRSALPIYRAANETFGYIDTGAIFLRAYNTFKPVLIFSAALMPDVNTYVDPALLPDGEAVAQHLQPAIYSQRRLADGYLIESSGPLTAGQLMVLTGGGLGGFFMGGGQLP